MLLWKYLDYCLIFDAFTVSAPAKEDQNKNIELNSTRTQDVNSNVIINNNKEN